MTKTSIMDKLNIILEVSQSSKIFIAVLIFIILLAVLAITMNKKNAKNAAKIITIIFVVFKDFWNCFKFNHLLGANIS